MLQTRDALINTPFYLRTKPQELREQFAPWRHRSFLIACA
jgi:hypothetical protein